MRWRLRSMRTSPCEARCRASRASRSFLRLNFLYFACVWFINQWLIHQVGQSQDGRDRRFTIGARKRCHETRIVIMIDEVPAHLVTARGLFHRELLAHQTKSRAASGRFKVESGLPANV